METSFSPADAEGRDEPDTRVGETWRGKIRTEKLRDKG